MIMIWRWIFLLPLIGQQLVAQLENDEEQQPVVTIREDVFFSIPWRYHLYIISQCKDVDHVITLYSSAPLSLSLWIFLFILGSFCERIRHNTCHILECFIVRIAQMIICKIANDLGTFSFSNSSKAKTYSDSSILPWTKRNILPSVSPTSLWYFS